MKKIKLLAGGICSSLMIFMGGACTELNLDEAGKIDYNTSLGLPVGNIRVEMASILNNIELDGLVLDSVNNNMSLQMTMPSETINFEVIDLELGATVNTAIDFSDNSPFKEFFEMFPYSDFEFSDYEKDIVIKEVINCDFQYSVDDPSQTIRIDSINIKQATFNIDIDMSGLKLTDNNPILVKIIFPVIAEDGQNITKERELTSNNQVVNIPLSNFKLEFPESTNTMPIDIEFTIPKSSSFTISKNAAISLSTNINVDGFDIIYGDFKSDKPIFEDNITMPLPTEILENEIIKNSKLLFANPQIDLIITSDLGIPILLSCDEVYAEDSNGNKVFASFNGNKYFTKTIDPPKTIGDFTTDTIRLDKNFGETNKLFEIVPQLMSYKWLAGIGESEIGEFPTQFITSESSMKIDMSATIPFELNPGSKIEYKDTLDLDLQSLIGSIADSIDINDLALSMGIKNKLPLSLALDAIFLDKNNKVLFVNEDLQINSAIVDGKGRSITASEQKANISFEDGELENVMQTKNIVFKLNLQGMDNKSKILLQLDDYININLGLFVNAGINIDLMNANN